MNAMLADACVTRPSMYFPIKSKRGERKYNFVLFLLAMRFHISIKLDAARTG